MGSGSSNLQVAADSTGPEFCSLGDVPENCISAVLTYLDPPDICRLARVNRSFNRASSADSVWENKLPSNYKFLLERVLGDDTKSTMSCKKDIFATLSRPIRFDGGTKEIWLEKTSGEVFLAISPKAMKITGIDDRRYWEIIPSDESRFGSISYLQQIWWLEAVGEIEFKLPRGTYSVLFKIHLGKPSRRFGRRAYNLDHVHGWSIKPVRFQLSTSDGQCALTDCYVEQSASNWISYHVGDFTVENPNSTVRVKFCMLQIDCTHTKGGLSLDCVIICPSQFRENLNYFN